MAEIDTLYRDHRINDITVNIATRINRTLVDQLQSKLPRRETRHKKMVMTCAQGEPEELGAQMCADLFESDGWEVKFLGGGIPEDEIVEFVGIEQPDVLLIYGTKPSGAPGVRRMIDQIHDIGACPQMQIMLAGGVFNRAEGLWEEIGADLFAPTAKEALKIALTDHRADLDGRKRKKRLVAELEPEIVQQL
jgi:methanogenic corrinoid protein MtbC1